MLHAEIVKMKHTFLFSLHIALPLLASGLFLLYYHVQSWSELTQIGAYIEVLGVALPLVISIICAANVGLEEQNHFQSFPGYFRYKCLALAGKCLVLWSMGVLAIAGAIILFGAGYGGLLGKMGISAKEYLVLTLILAGGSLPVYLEHLFLNFTFSRTISQCVGVVQSVFSALLLTGLGDGIWQFFPCTWSARGASTMFNLAVIRQELNIEKMSAYTLELRRTWTICPLFLTGMCVIIGLWFYHYEGRQCND